MQKSYCLPMWGLAIAGLAIATPSIARSEKSDDPSKFFLFHHDDVSEDVARGDYLYCIKIARTALSPRAKTQSIGLLEGLINGRFADVDSFRMRNAVMRKCMALHGYRRYAVAENFWNAIVKGGDIVIGNDGKVDPQVVDALSAFASGTKPETGMIDQ